MVNELRKPRGGGRTPGRRQRDEDGALRCELRTAVVNISPAFYRGAGDATHIALHGALLRHRGLGLVFRHPIFQSATDFWLSDQLTSILRNNARKRNNVEKRCCQPLRTPGFTLD